jgi:hypothetical protein
VDEAGRNDIDAIAFTLLPRVVATSDVVKPLGRNNELHPTYSALSLN